MGLICDDFNESNERLGEKSLCGWVTGLMERFKGKVRVDAEKTYNANWAIFGDIIEAASEDVRELCGVAARVIRSYEPDEEPTKLGRCEKPLAWVHRLSRIQLHE